MDITPRHEEGMMRIESYGVRGFTINGVLYDCAVMLCGDQTLAYPELSIDALNDDATYAPFHESSCTMLLVGTGAQQHFVPASLRRILKEQHGITLDVMNTGAACRTFNVLRSEGRSVDALLLPVR